MKLQIRVDDKLVNISPFTRNPVISNNHLLLIHSNSGIISEVKFKTFGCGSAIASSSYLTERVKGLSLEDAGKIRNTEIAKELALPPVKLHCSSQSLIHILSDCIWCWNSD